MTDTNKTLATAYVNVYTAPVVELDFEPRGTYANGAERLPAFTYRVAQTGTLWGGKGQKVRFVRSQGRRTRLEGDNWGAADIAAELAAHWGGVVKLRGREFCASIHAKARRCDLVSGHNVELVA